MALFLGKTGKDIGSDLTFITSFVILELILCQIVMETSNKTEKKFAEWDFETIDKIFHNIKITFFANVRILAVRNFEEF